MYFWHNSLAIPTLFVFYFGVFFTFSDHLTDVNERPIKMCLIGNKTVMELTNSDQIVGKIFIEDEDHKQSKGICESSSPTLDQSKIYSCRIESNVIDVTPLKQDFYIDKNLFLHGHTTFDFSARSQYLVPLMCTDKSKPIHTIELSVTVRVKGSLLYIWGEGCVIVGSLKLGYLWLHVN